MSKYTYSASHGVRPSVPSDIMEAERKRLQDTANFYRESGNHESAKLLESQIEARLKKFAGKYHTSQSDFAKASGPAGAKRHEEATRARLTHPGAIAVKPPVMATKPSAATTRKAKKR